jgi:cytochrome c oxidase subunit 3
MTQDTAENETHTDEAAHDKTAADAEHKQEGENHEHAEGDHAHGDAHAAGGPMNDHGPDPSTLSRDIGTFFSIYYCMTGLHAIHIIGGIIALSWLYWRSLLGQWRSDYFGPVDYVGLYWHLVDLIWIYLFPLLYLID